MFKRSKLLLAIALASSSLLSGCSGSGNSVEFPENPAPMPAEDSEAPELDNEAESKP